MKFVKGVLILLLSNHSATAFASEGQMSVSHYLKFTAENEPLSLSFGVENKLYISLTNGVYSFDLTLGKFTRLLSSNSITVHKVCQNDNGVFLISAPNDGVSNGEIIQVHAWHLKPEKIANVNRSILSAVCSKKGLGVFTGEGDDLTLVYKADNGLIDVKQKKGNTFDCTPLYVSESFELEYFCKNGSGGSEKLPSGQLFIPSILDADTDISFSGIVKSLNGKFLAFSVVNYTDRIKEKICYSASNSKKILGCLNLKDGVSVASLAISENGNSIASILYEEKGEGFSAHHLLVANLAQ